MAFTPERMGPKPRDSATLNRKCAACHERFEVGDFTTMIPLGPGNDPDSQERAREGRYYIPVGIEVHWACHTGTPNPPPGNKEVGSD
jgi:hypothetical protein